LNEKESLGSSKTSREQQKCSLSTVQVHFGIESRDGLGGAIIQIFSQLFFFPEKTALLFPKKFPNNGGWAYQLAYVQPLAGGCTQAPDSFCGRAEA